MVNNGVIVNFIDLRISMDTENRPEYLAPLQDMRFLMDDMPGPVSTGDGSIDNSDILFVLDMAAKFSQQELVPINATGDKEGCKFANGQVTLPVSMKSAFEQYAQDGWMGLSMPEEWGGQALPERLSTCVGEILTSANHAFSMTPALTMSACRAIISHGADELKETYLKNLISGKWTGTMCLTESQSGSDLGLIRTKAIVDGEHYRVSGNKIFISSGNHDGSTNIIHLVLARLEEAPKGIKGLSLFLVPEKIENADGAWVVENNVHCIGIEEKMGMHANPTCSMSFEGSKGYLIGEQNKGINAMFTMMNEMRLAASLQGIGLSERSFQKSVAYAAQRTQMRSLSGVKAKDKEADPLLVHPDVRRMLLTQKVLAEGGRALAQFCSELLDKSHDPECDKATIALLDMLTPIAKGFCTETGLESASHAIQMHGGHGFITETGAEQLYRDGRISTLYEGTSGIQALDLLGRKVLGTQGKSLMSFTKLMHQLVKENSENKIQKPLLDILAVYTKEWPDLTMKIGMKAMKNPDEAGAASYDYLMYSGYVSLAYFWAKMALVSQSILDGDRNSKSGALSTEFLDAKIKNAKFYFDRILPRAEAHKMAMMTGMDSMMNLTDEQFMIQG